MIQPKLHEVAKKQIKKPPLGKALGSSSKYGNQNRIKGNMVLTTKTLGF